MGRQKKDSKPLNVSIERSVHEALEAYCDESGMSKTIAVERALLMYIKAMESRNGDGKERQVDG